MFSRVGRLEGGKGCGVAGCAVAQVESGNLYKLPARELEKLGRCESVDFLSSKADPSGLRIALGVGAVHASDGPITGAGHAGMLAEFGMFNDGGNAGASVPWSGVGALKAFFSGLDLGGGHSKGGKLRLGGGNGSGWRVGVVDDGLLFHGLAIGWEIYRLRAATMAAAAERAARMAAAVV
jgi:hypothetical protein